MKDRQLAAALVKIAQELMDDDPAPAAIPAMATATVPCSLLVPGRAGDCTLEFTRGEDGKASLQIQYPDKDTKKSFDPKVAQKRLHDLWTLMQLIFDRQ